MFPDFDQSLRQSMRRETEMLFDSVLREHRSALELLTANYTFLNERLARHYGISGVQGSHFRRVMLNDDSPRRGLLGQGSILTITSHAVRTSPVLRGKFVLEAILGTPPPPPPPNVPTLPEKKGGAKILTVRERMAEHRANPVCASCHSTIDPLGFALENFDAVGRYRRVEQESYDTGAPPGLVPTIDASGTLPDGSKFNGIVEFREALVRNPEQFATTLTEKFLTFALGRGLESYDMPAVRRIVHEAAGNQYQLSSLILGIVKSLPFQMRRAPTGDATSVAVTTAAGR
jgi:hypothetical protein